MNEYLAILWTEKIIAFAIILQSIELILIRNSFSDSGIWRWENIKKDFETFPSFFKIFLYSLLPYKNFLLLLFVRIIFGFALLFYSNFLILFILLLSSFLISIRWRGAFNGGSDYMTILILLALSINSIFSDSSLISLAVLLYIAIQLCTSYFISGVVKLNKNNWRNGNALIGFMESGVYNKNFLAEFICNNKIFSLLLSWLIIIFEVSFFFSLSNAFFAIGFILFAIIFHIGNAHLFGLNRFLYAWSACYPALYFCSAYIHSI